MSFMSDIEVNIESVDGLAQLAARISANRLITMCVREPYTIRAWGY